MRSQIVIDASAFVELLTRTPLASRIDRAIGDAELIGPDILNPEVLQSLRGLERGGMLSNDRASMAVVQLAESRLQLVPTTGLVREAWSMRNNLSAYDACYVALARLFDCPLLTVDGPLRRAPRLDVTVISIQRTDNDGSPQGED